jgi:hypothetical protein
MPKLKNFLQDLGSAVVPAAVSAGLTYASGGTINPATTPGLLKLLAAGGAGARGFAANEEEERRRKQMRRQAEENRRAQGTANLINALQPGTGARARPAEIAAPKAGLGETVARGTATGIQAFTMAKQAQEAWKERERQRVLTEQQIATGEEEAEIFEGRKRAIEELLQRNQREERTAEGLRQTVAGQGDLLTRPRQQIQTEAEAMSTLGTSPETFDPRLFAGPEVAASATQQLGAMGAGPGLEAAQAAPPPTGSAAVGYYEIMEADKKRRDLEFEAAQKLDLDRRRVETLEARLEVDRTIAGNNETRLALLAAEKEVADGLAREKRVQDAMRLLQGNIEGNELYEKREANVRFIQDAIQGYASNNALGDLQLLKAVALMQDPTGTVKEQEFETMAGAAGELARLGINLNNYLAEATGEAGGRRLDDRSRNMFVQNAIVAYDNRSAATASDIALAVNREFTISGTPLDELQKIGNSYHLPTGASLFGNTDAGKALQGVYAEEKSKTAEIYTGTGGLPELQTGQFSEEQLAELARMAGLPADVKDEKLRAFGARLLADAQDSDEQSDSGGARFGKVERPSLSNTGGVGDYLNFDDVKPPPVSDTGKVIPLPGEEEFDFFDEGKRSIWSGAFEGLGMGQSGRSGWSEAAQREYDRKGQQWTENLLEQLGDAGRYLGRGLFDPNRSLRRMRGN